MEGAQTYVNFIALPKSVLSDAFCKNLIFVLSFLWNAQEIKD